MTDPTWAPSIPSVPAGRAPRFAEGNPLGTFSEREPVRLPLWLTILGSNATAFGIAMLTGSPWKPALAAVLASVGPLLFGVEVARQRAWSPLSVLRATEDAREDERSSADAAG